MKEEKMYYQLLKKTIEREDIFLNNTQLAYEIILQEILNGNFAQAEKIPQETLAALLDMSRTPVRDALMQLEQEGYLEKNEKNGFQVKRMSLKDYVDFCEFRLILETKAAYFAARNISKEDLTALRENIDKMKKTIEIGNVQEQMKLDNQFHTLIAKASNNTYIYETIKQYQVKEMYHMSMATEEGKMRFVMNKHKEIYDALCENNEDKAQKAMQSHLQFYIKNIYHMY